MVGDEKSRRKTKTVSNRFPLTPNVVAFTVQIQQLHFTTALDGLQSERLFVLSIAANRTPPKAGGVPNKIIRNFDNNLKSRRKENV